MSATTQQHLYESSYAVSAGAISFPDWNITGGELLSEKKILTLGGGIANDVWHLAGKNLVVNADYAAPGLLAGKAFGVHGVSVNFNSTGSLPFPDRSFDLIVCKDILEHVLEPLPLLQEAMRIVRDSGEIVISVPNHFYWPMRLRLLLGKGLIWRGVIADHGAYNEWDYMHIRFFTYKGFRRFLHAAGLKPVRFYWDFGNLAYYHNPDRWLLPQLQKRADGKPLSKQAKFGVYVVRPLWRIFNILFPRPMRSAIVSLCPGLLCSGFYVRCVKK